MRLFVAFLSKKLYLNEKGERKGGGEGYEDKEEGALVGDGGLGRGKRGTGGGEMLINKALNPGFPTRCCDARNERGEQRQSKNMRKGKNTAL